MVTAAAGCKVPGSVRSEVFACDGAETTLHPVTAALLSVVRCSASRRLPRGAGDLSPGSRACHCLHCFRKRPTLGLLRLPVSPSAGRHTLWSNGPSGFCPLLSLPNSQRKQRGPAACPPLPHPPAPQPGNGLCSLPFLPVHLQTNGCSHSDSIPCPRATGRTPSLQRAELLQKRLATLPTALRRPLLYGHYFIQLTIPICKRPSLLLQPF